MSYEYSPLQSLHQQIRILKLLPADTPSAEVHCELSVVSLNDNPQYSALSYCWHDPPTEQRIKLHNIDTAVTSNLHAALVALRDKTDVTFWWIDALCINQKDKEERSLQILRMTSIYSTANHVVAWVGSQNSDQPTLGELLEATRDKLLSYQRSNLDIIHFQDLLSRKFWRRVWIAQEISVATDVRVMCGSSWVKWDTLCEVMKICEELNLFDCSPADRSSSHKVIGLPKSTSLVGLPDTSDDDELTASYHGFSTFRDFRERSRSSVPVSFITALKLSRSLLATDRRDRYFALLGLVHDGLDFISAPDYGLSPSMLQSHIAKRYLLRTYRLDVVVAGGKRQILDGSVPSWTPDWNHLGPEGEYALSRKANQKFRASGDHNYIPIHPPSDAPYLSISCLIFGQIDALSTSWGSSKSQEPTQEISLPSSSQKDNANHNKWIAWMPSLQNDRELERLRGSLINCLLNGPSLLDPSKTMDSGYSLLWNQVNYNLGKAGTGIFSFWAGTRNDTLDRWLEDNKFLKVQKVTLGQIYRYHRVEHIVPFARLFHWTQFLLGFLTSVVLLGPPRYKTLEGQRHYLFLAKISERYLIMSLIYGLSSFLRSLDQAYTQLVTDTENHMAGRELKLAVTGSSSGFRNELKGAFALVPPCSRPGDLLAILKGCTVPVILRTHQDGFQVVGMTYLHEVMDGQIVDKYPQAWKECKLY